MTKKELIEKEKKLREKLGELKKQMYNIIDGCGREEFPFNLGTKIIEIADVLRELNRIK